MAILLGSQRRFPGQVLVEGGLSSPGAGTDSERLGLGALADGLRSTAVGNNSTAGGLESFAGGFGADAAAARSVAIVPNAPIPSGAFDAIAIRGSVLNPNDIAIGGFSASAGGSVAVGASALAGAEGAAVGVGSQSGAFGAVFTAAYGNRAKANNTNTVALGPFAETGGTQSIVGGAFADSRQDGAVYGYLAQGLGVRSSLLGSFTADNGFADAAILGSSAAVNAASATALGKEATVAATHTGSVAIAFRSLTTAAQRTTIGRVGGLSTELQQLQVSNGFAAFGIAPPASQPAKITDPTDLASALTAIAAIIDVLEGAGLSAAA